MSKRFGRYSTMLGASLVVVLPIVANGEDSAESVQELTVTAQRREASIQDVGMSVSQFSGDTLQELKISTSQNLGAQIPGVSIKNTFGEEMPTFTFRGIGTNDASAINNQTVSVYVDGVMKPYNIMLGGQLFDLERVEVLKGPQGTLYGSNNTGGAVHFITRKPTREPSGFARVDYGRYETVDYEGAFGGGISESLAGRISIAGKNRGEGFQRNRFFGGAKSGKVDHIAVRGQLLWEPSETLDVLFSAHASDHDDDMLNFVNVSTQDPAFAFGGPPAVLCGPALEGRRSEGACTNFVGYFDADGNDLVGDFNNSLSTRADGRLPSQYKGSGGSMKIEWQLPRATLTSLTAYDEFERENKEDSDQSPFLLLEGHLKDDLKSFSQEIILSSDESWSIEWLTGVNYHTDEDDGDVVFYMRDLTATNTTNTFAQEVEAAAAFAHLGWRFAEAWKLSGGVRVTHETRTMDQTVVDNNPFGTSLFTRPASFCALVGICGVPGTPFAGLAPAPPTPGSTVLASLSGRELSVTDVSGEIGLDWKPTEDMLLYTKLSKGFKSGAFNGIVAFSQADLEPAEEEKVYAWEAGLKASALDRALQVNSALFYMNWIDFQAQISASSPPGAFPLENAGDADIWGFETEIDYQPAAIEGLRLRFGLGYLYTYVTESNPNLRVNLKGNELHDAPEWAFNGLIRYTRPLSGALNLTLQTDFSWEDDKFFEAKNVPPISQDALWLVNARIAVGSQDGRWEFALWGRNVFDEEYLMDMFDFTETTGTGLGQVGFPREVGVGVIYRWD